MKIFIQSGPCMLTSHVHVRSTCRRNELVALDLVVTAVAGSFAFISMIWGVYGMNFKNKMVGKQLAKQSSTKL